MNRHAIAWLEAEPQKRFVSLNEALGIAAVLGVAPIHLIVPFEDHEIISEEAAEAGIFEPTAGLKIGDKDEPELTLSPIEARKWIRGKAIYPDAPRDLHHRFYCVEVPPARRYQLRQDARRVLGEPMPKRKTPPEERERELGFRTPAGKLRGLPESLWTWLMFEPKEESSDA